MTLVTFHHVHLFGKIENGKMHLNEFGRIVREEWFKSAEIRKEIKLDNDEFVVMPNHIHGIVYIDENRTQLPITYENIEPLDTNITIVGTGDRPVARTRKSGPPKRSTGSFIAGFKSSVTTRINMIRKRPGQPVWLRNYYEHIIETEKEYFNIANYIHDNPENWGMKDEYYSD